MTCAIGAREQIPAGGLHARENCESGIAQRDVLGAFLLGVMGRLRPHAAAEIELRPLGRENFHFPGTGDDQESDGVSGHLIWITVKRIGERLKLFNRELRFARVFVIALNAAIFAAPRWIVGCLLRPNCEREDRRQQRENTVRTNWPCFE